MRQTEFFIILSYFLHFYPPNNPENQYFEKMKQGSREAIILHMYQKPRSYDVCFLRYGAWQTEIFAILGHFLPLYPTNNQGNQNLEKMKNPADIIILHVSSINENNMIYGSWDMECDRQYFFSFWTILCHFHPLRTQKIKIFNKRKKHLEMSFYICVPWMKLYDVWFLKHGARQFLLILDQFLPFYPLNPKNQNFEKMKKTLGDIIIL